ncbi:Alpha/Beta hydrolase protein [Gorgonomyces haynaldii]|nr:Alpha/Beta hydrolase protein [Gorgonomyces haynaldii]
MALAFYDRFEKQPVSRWELAYKIMHDVLPVLVTSPLTYAVKGPPVKEWTLSYYVGVRVINAYLAGDRAKSKPNIAAAQERSLHLRPKLPPGTLVTQEIINPEQSVIDFIKTHQPGEWPPHAGNTGHEILCEWYSTPESEDRVILHLHGGAYVHGSSRTHAGIITKMAKSAKAKVFAVNYRLAPQNPYPCGLIDAVSAYLHLLKTHRPDQIVVMGDSAGGGLSFALLLCLRDWKQPLPAGGYLQSPWVDLTDMRVVADVDKKNDYLPAGLPTDERLQGRTHYYAANDALTCPYVSPTFASFHDLPPILMQTGTEEKLHDMILKVKEKMQDVPLVFEEYHGHVHVFQLFSYTKGSQTSLDRAGKWIIQVTSGDVPQNAHTQHGFDGSLLQ